MTTCQAPIGPNLRSMASLITYDMLTTGTGVAGDATLPCCLHLKQPVRRREGLQTWEAFSVSGWCLSTAVTCGLQHHALR